MAITAYPLSWPLKAPKTPGQDRKRARFQGTAKNTGNKRPLTVTEARARLIAELGRYGAGRVDMDSVVVSTNVPLRQDGQPMGRAGEPADSAAVVYFELDGKPYALPCDKWDRVADNLAAIAAHIEADRGQERWGVGSTSDRYAGFLALPPGKDELWYEVLEVVADATAAQIVDAYRRKLRTAHPDTGGSDAAFDRITKARDAGLAVATR